MTPPTERQRRALLWQAIEKFLFSPVGARNQTGWCTCYLRSLYRFWGTDEIAVSGGGFPAAEFSVPLPAFSLEYDLSEWNSQPSRSSVRVRFENVVFASHHIDHAYHPQSFLLDPPDDGILRHYPTISTRADDILKDIGWVLDRFMLHPCAHVHPEPAIFKLLRADHEPFREVLHEIRLGLGLTNPFAALFQLRLQLVLADTPAATKKRKKAERDRVAKLVLQALLRGEHTNPISPGALFGLKR